MNPVAQLINILQTGGNPEKVLEMMAQNNPVASQTLNMCRGKSVDQLKTIAENLARNSGTDINKIARNLGIRLP